MSQSNETSPGAADSRVAAPPLCSACLGVEVPPDAACSAPSVDDVSLTREALDGAKLRAGRKMTIDTALMKTRTWFTIEAWSRAKRQYITLCVGEVWRYETAEARDAVLAALTKPNTHVGNDAQK